MHQKVVAALLLMAGLAGCMGGDDGGPGKGAVDERLYGPGYQPKEIDARGFPVGEPLCDEVCDFEMTPDEGREGNEVTIAVNPLDPRNVVGGAKDYYEPDAGECVWDGVYVTHDGGATYEDRSFDGSPWRQLDEPDPSKTNYATQFWCTTDPVAYFDVNGNLYYLLMAYQTDPVSGSKACQDECPRGSLNDWAFNRAVQIVAISDDGGDSFHTFTPVLEGTYPIAFHDKGWIAASGDGTIHVMWLSFIAGNLYFRSTDGGQTFAEPEVLAPYAVVLPDAGQGSFVDVGTGPEVYAVWTNAAGVQMRRSMDTGATWDAQRTVQGINGAAMPGLSERDRRGGFPPLATDRNPDSPFADALYIVWQDACREDTWSDACGQGGGSAVWATASHDKGDTWSDPVRISAGTEAWRIFPTVSVSPGGVVDVAWMDTEGTRMATLDGEEHATFDQLHAYSLDGGATWSEPRSVRDADDGGWDPALCHHQNGMIFIGDYNDIDSSWQAAHPVWPDSRHGVCDVYTATVQRPMFAEGWSDEARSAAEQWIRDHPLR